MKDTVAAQTFRDRCRHLLPFADYLDSLGVCDPSGPIVDKFLKANYWNHSTAEKALKIFRDFIERYTGIKLYLRVPKNLQKRSEVDKSQVTTEQAEQLIEHLDEMINTGDYPNERRLIEDLGK